RFYPPLSSRPIYPIEKPRNCSTSLVQPAASLLTEAHFSSGKSMTSKRSFDTSIPPNESIAIFVSLSCWCGLVPGQLFGYGRSDRSSKLTHGLESETAAGFRSRRECGHDPAPVTPHNALFSSYKTGRVHHAARRRGGCVAVRGTRAAAGDAGNRFP